MYYKSCLQQKPDGSYDKEASLKAFEPLRAIDPRMYEITTAVANKCCDRKYTNPISTRLIL